MQKTIISDASCLILLDNIGELYLLHKLYGIVLTTPEVAAEFGKAIPDWLLIKQAENHNYQYILNASVDKGEASAIALAIDYPGSILIIDDLKGRKLAIQLGLHTLGTMGIFIDAKEKGIIELVKPMLEKVRKTNFRITKNIETIILEKAGEL